MGQPLSEWFQSRIKKGWASPPWRKIDSIEPLESATTVYNFEVEDNHDYFVGSLGLLVHNVGPCDPKNFDNLADALEQDEGVNNYADTASNPYYDINTDKSGQAVQNLLNKLQGTSIDDWDPDDF